MSHPNRRARLVMQLRARGIGDTEVLRALELVPRELFVPDRFADQAWEDTALPISHGQTISAPSVVAAMSAALVPDRALRVLEIGTGSGYQAAVLARLFRRVYTVERHRGLQAQALARLEACKLKNVTARVGDGMKGWPEAAPFDRIIVTAGAAHPPGALTDQLAEGGILVMPVGGAHQHVTRFVRKGDRLESEKLWQVRFVPLLPGLGEDQASA